MAKRAVRLGLWIVASLIAVSLAAGAPAGAQGFPPAHSSEIHVRQHGDSTIVYGVARDAMTGSPLGGLLVYPLPEGSHDGKGAVTDSRGWFRLSFAGGAPTQLRVELIGYEGRELAVPEGGRSVSFHVMPIPSAICDYVWGPGGRPEDGSPQATDWRITIGLYDLETGRSIQGGTQVAVSRIDEGAEVLSFEVTPNDSVALPIQGPGVYTLQVDADGYGRAGVGPFIIPQPICELSDPDPHHHHLWLRRR